MRLVPTILLAALALVVMVRLVVAAETSSTLTQLGSQYTFSNVQEGQTLSENVTVIVRDYGPLDVLSFCIDGKQHASNFTENDGSGRYTVFGIPTRSYADGPHTIEVTAPGAGRQYALDRRHVFFLNHNHPQREPPVTLK